MPALSSSLLQTTISVQAARKAKSDLIDGNIGEGSRFHETFGFYAQGVSLKTAVLPAGWRDRLVVLDNERTKPGLGDWLTLGVSIALDVACVGIIAKVLRAPSAIIGRIARAQAGQGVTHLLGALSLAQKNAYLANPAGGSRFLGTAVHTLVLRELRTQFPGRFEYFFRGPDFLDNVTHTLIELTTVAQKAGHEARYGSVWNGNPVKYTTYVLPK
jgi:hypothetical protein